MKKTKLYAKKTLSVLMAVMMLMTAWVWVAPEKAEAAADVAPATTYSTYHVKLTVEFENIGKGGHVIIYYYPVNSDGSLNTSVRGEYVLVNSAKQYSSTTWTFDTADDSTRRLSQDTSAETGPVQGWPCGVKVGATSSAVVRLTGLTIGNKSVILNGGSWGASGGNTKEILYNNTGSGWDGYLDWPEPAITTVNVSAAQTVSVPKGGSGSATFTASFYDQYGVAWANQTIENATINLSGASVAKSGNSATVTANETVFANSGYNSSNGQISTTLSMTKGNVTRTVNVTFQSPKYNVNLYYFNGNLAKTYSNMGYYKQSVTLSDLPANSTATPISGDNDQHQPYQWPANISQAHTLDKDITINEVKGSPVAHSYGAWTDAGENHTRTCSVCGYVQTQAHVENRGTVDKEETCTEDGIKTYDCTVCGKQDIRTETINNITGHDFSGAITIKEDGENGTHWRKCSRCDVYGWPGLGEGESVAHNWDKNNDGVVDAGDAETKASTCETAGYEKYTCKDCGATWTKELPLAAHKVTATAAKDVTNQCGGDGNVAFWTCSVCDKIFTDASCTAEVTDYTDNDSDGIPDVLETKGPDHNFTGAYVSASGGKDGTHYRQCTRFTQCGAYGLMVDGQAVTGATEKHTWGDPAVTDATCEKEGKKVYTCTSGCGETYEEKIDKVPHSMTKTDAVEPECGKAGNYEYYYCSICKKYYKDANGTTETTVANETRPALTHTWTAHHAYDTLVSAATCQSAAVYNNHCDYCGVQIVGATHSYGTADTVNGHKFDGAVKKNENGTHSYKCTVEGCTEYGNATSCTYVITADTASTCSNAGYTTYICSICSNGYSTTKALDTANHEGEGTYTVGEKEASCYYDGYTGNVHCSGCDAKLTDGETIPADKTKYPHEDMRDYEAKASTCQTEGWNAYRYCAYCDTYEIEKVTVAKRDHKFTTYTSNNDGTHTAVCVTCNEDVATPATDTKNCSGGTANCVDKAVCSVCSGEYGEVNSANHKTPELVAKVDATCQKPGTEAYYKCTACGVNIDTPETIEKLDHTYGAWTKLDGEDKHTRSCTTCDPAVADVATETADCNGGAANCVDKAKCADCKAEYGTTNPAVHKTEANTLKGAVPATCQAPGYTGDYHYNCCDVVKEQGEEIAQLEHTYSIEVEGSRIAATCIAAGEVTYKCSTCVETEDVKAATEKKVLPIDANNHATPDKTVTVGKKAATCEEDGHTGDVYYECCYDETKTAAENKKALKEKGTVVKANGQHVYGQAIPEYMIERIDETKDEEGKVTSRTIVVKQTAPDYEAKIAFRHGDNKWYHAQQCTVCNTIVYSACYTYAHTFNCVDTDNCEVCDGLCSLIDENNHKSDLIEVTEGAVAATCMTDGKKSYYKCEDCGKTYFDEAGKNPLDLDSAEDLAKLVISKTTVSHKWDEGEETEGTCGEAGKIVYKCTVDGCNATKEISTGVSSQNHSWKAEYEVIKEPTCHSVGYKVIKCEICGSVKPNSSITISATGEHDFDANKDGTVDRNDAVITEGESCQKPGTLTFTCQNEGCTYTKTETDTEGVSAHIFGEWVTIGGDCATGIAQERICTECGTKEHQTLTTDTHELVVYVRVEPTPEKAGYVIYECANCKMKTDPVPLEYEGEEPADTHIIDETQYRTVKEATCSEAEKREYTCLRCGEKVVMYYGELEPHYWLEQPAEVSTCDRAGHSAYYRCVRCLAEQGRVDYEPLGHADNDGDGKCDECNSAFYGDGSSTCGCICHKESGFMKFIYKIINFFWKLFKIAPACDCGAKHY